MTDRPPTSMSRLELASEVILLRGQRSEAVTALRAAEVGLRAECGEPVGLATWKLVHGAIVKLGGTTE